jgi:UDP-N-acetylmuramoyl-tripeptide--D-alanyl-D-alanine ligase
VGITGSVGKTSTKDLVASALSVAFKTHANERSFNNDFGLPTTILNAPDETQALVLEMGMRGFGEIAKLCSVAHPQIGVVTAVAKAHTERVGSIEGVAIAKRELIEALPKAGIAVLNRDDERVWEMRKSTDATVLSFGASEHADVRMVNCTIDDRGCARADVASPWGKVELVMQVAGRHMAHNA